MGDRATADRTYRIIGQVKNEADQGIPGVRVEAWDKDLLLDDFLDKATTGEDGRFEISIREGIVKELPLAPHPDLLFNVFLRASRLPESYRAHQLRTRINWRTREKERRHG